MSHEFSWRNGAGPPGGGGKRPRVDGVCDLFDSPHGCPRGEACPFLHLLPGDVEGHAAREQPRKKPELTAEQEASRQAARGKYNAWKRFLKRAPVANDIGMIESLWTGALKILNADDRNCKQELAKDLDHQELFGRQHMQTVLGMVTHDNGAATFVSLVRPFLLVISHRDLLNCLAVDTSVGAIFNFISGSNGSRAIPFFRTLLNNLNDLTTESNTQTSPSALEETFTGATISLREILRREQRALFHDDLPALVGDFEEFSSALSAQHPTVAFRTTSVLAEVRGMIARARGLLHNEGPKVNGVSTTVVTSTFPREIELPGGRHDNDKDDIADIQILPTENEIKSEHRKEYLPSTDRDHPHHLSDTVQRHIDTNFRLYRHDIFGALKDDIGGFMLAVEKNPSLMNSPRIIIGDIRSSYIFRNAHISEIRLHPRRDLEAFITFTQPQPLRNSTAIDRHRWWDETRRLNPGNLLCYISFNGTKTSLLFFVVTEKELSKTAGRVGLVSDPQNATIHVSLATRSQMDFELMTQLRCELTKGLLVELPGVIPGTFIPVLENLQNMQRQSRLPFRDWILPEQATTPGPLDIPPPLYAQSEGFRFSLNPLLIDPDDELSIDATMSQNDPDIIDEIEKRTELDRGQCEALVAGLTREFAFIQGPPGTGKSYLGVALMKVLLECAEEADLGPILVVTYQFLEHLIQMGVEKIVRLGSKSNSAVLKGKNLKVVSQDEPKTKSEGYGIHTNRRKLEEGVEPIQKLCEALHTCVEPNWTAIEEYLAEEYPLIQRQFSRVDEDGFQAVGQDPFSKWRLAGPNFTANTGELDIELILAQAEVNVHVLSAVDRRRLVAFWMSNIRRNITDDLFESLKEARVFRQNITNIHEEVDRRVLQAAQVIGVTTTGLAGRISTLRHVSCKVIICEEAGEIMEPHMLSALIPSVEHVISIGDHQQLRPKIINFNLSLESSQGALFQLDRSQFERLSVGEKDRKPFPVAQLNVQRRMRPAVSRLIRETLYPKLIDHDSTKNLPPVVGLRGNVYWLDHENLEDEILDDSQVKSRSNEWEIDMTHALLRHIIRQGAYKSDDIAVLTPYTGQLQKLRSKFKREFEVVLSDLDEDSLEKDGLLDGELNEFSDLANRKKPLEKKQMSQLLRLATIDNFQGEEAKVIIISLVRSNKRKDPGFLKTTNRINVLLSRAQHGLYLIGNAETMSHAPMWNRVIGLLQEEGSIGKSFSLCCPRHMDTTLEASTPEDFPRVSPEGGCRLLCNRTLSDCDHPCQARCHSEAMHLSFSCMEDCERIHKPCGHPCNKTCGEKCGDCKVKVDDVELACGHLNQGIPCFKTDPVLLEEVQCKAVVSENIPTCGHGVDRKCCEEIDFDVFKCAQPCDEVLPCGDKCPGTCGTCKQKGDNGEIVVKHRGCSKICGRGFPTCNHKCLSRCHGDSDCGPCLNTCQVMSNLYLTKENLTLTRCRVSRAPRNANGLASIRGLALCLAEHHVHVYLATSDAPSHFDADTAAPACVVCCKDGKQDAEVDIAESKKYSDVDLDQSPIIVLGCGHFFTAKSLDSLVGMPDVYEINDSGEFVGLKDFSNFATAVPCCPQCKQPIRQHVVNRYNRVISRAINDQMSRKLLSDGNSKLQDMEAETAKLDQNLKRLRDIVVSRLEGHRNEELPAPLKTELEKLLQMGFESSTRVLVAVTKASKSLVEIYKSTQVLNGAITACRRSVDGRSLDAATPPSPPSARDARMTLGRRGAEIKAKYVILADSLHVSRILRDAGLATPLKTPGGSPEAFCIPFFEMARMFINDCFPAMLMRMAVEAMLYFSKIARAYETFCHATDIDLASSNTILVEADDYLKSATWLCDNFPFQNSEALKATVQETQKSLQKPWFEDVTSEEVASVKYVASVLEGSFYTCEKGHPFTLTECGTSMQLATCPECGSRIDGLEKLAVSGAEFADD
ncbi:NFX1-type zinc finger-containing protein [Lachnellula willkommii]|uniref:NFX1-type zinc finger-containing protein n=1 Tax=Lachnellula willkommii TaxID=215461 RepID=A0A559MBW7_9HELO|nr:NFX1-type zinc finger-containing protein [Lachnellula willkommii]